MNVQPNLNAPSFSGSYMIRREDVNMFGALKRGIMHDTRFASPDPNDSTAGKLGYWTTSADEITIHVPERFNWAIEEELANDDITYYKKDSDRTVGNSVDFAA